MTTTYTRTQAMERLGIKSRSAFHHLRKQYPQAFVVIRQGHGREGTLYHKPTLDTFIEWRKTLEEVRATPFTPISFAIPKRK